MAVKGIVIAALALAVLIGLALPRPGGGQKVAQSQVSKLSIE